MTISIDSVNYADSKVWELLISGRTAGVFQCESPLVQSWLMKIKPANIWELSAVIALVRPGPLKSGFADDYVKYRENPDLRESFGHPIIDEVFRTTEGVLIYQEQMMNLGGKLAWSHLSEKDKLLKVDGLRKAVGKKNQQKILEIGKDFVEGCIHNQLSQELADKLFEIIKNSGRYAFNLSHSIAYATVAYHTAYFKVNYPLQFFATYLSYAQEKQNKWEEIDKLCKDARYFGIPISLPNINSQNLEFCIENDSIRFGLHHIKYGLNPAVASKISGKVNTLKDFIKICFTDQLGTKLRSNTAIALISCNAFSDLKINRKILLDVYNFVSELTDREISNLLEMMGDSDTPSDIASCGRRLIVEVCNARRSVTVDSHLQFYNKHLENGYDHPALMEKLEKEYMGTILSGSVLDGKNVSTSDRCADCGPDARLYTGRNLSVVIDTVIHTVTKKGKNPGQPMARISVRDSSGELDNLPVFPELFSQCGHLLIEKNTINVNILKLKGGWVAQNISQL